MGKYTSLEKMLSSSAQDEVNMAFAELETVLGFPLPASAYNHRPWWANGGHSQAFAWLNAGYKVAQVDFQNRMVHFRKDGSAPVRQQSPKAKSPIVTPGARADYIPIAADAKALKVLGYEFRFIQQLHPQCDAEGRIKKFYPQDAYDNKNNLPFLYHGSGAFCRFSIQAGALPGVYLWVTNGEIIYIGETENLQRRFNTGYGIIAPRNCFAGGQSTNCKMNKVVLTLFEQGQVIDLYFYETKNYKQVELDLLRKIKTQFNKKDNEWVK